jgi:hypothetical protein
MIQGAANTVAATSEGVGTALDDFADKHRLDKQDIIELALFDCFAKYDENYTDLRKEDDK